MAQYLLNEKQWIPLQLGSHTTEELKIHALEQIEREAYQWSETQLEAYNFLYRFLHDPAYEDIEAALQNDPTLGSTINAKTGHLFFGGGLEAVRDTFEYNRAKADRDGILGEALSIPNIGASVYFNAAHEKYREAAYGDRRRIFLGNKFHENDHIYFFRYEIRPPETYTEHHHGWLMVAESIERRASELFGMQFEPSLAKSFNFECWAMNDVCLTDNEILFCFGDQFSRLSDSKTLLYHGAPIAGLGRDSRKRTLDANSDFIFIEAGPLFL